MSQANTRDRQQGFIKQHNKGNKKLLRPHALGGAAKGGVSCEGVTWSLICRTSVPSLSSASVGCTGAVAAASEYFMAPSRLPGALSCASDAIVACRHSSDQQLACAVQPVPFLSREVTFRVHRTLKLRSSTAYSGGQGRSPLACAGAQCATRCCICQL